MNNELAILQRFVTGDRDAFACLYESYYQQVYNFASLYIRYKEDVEEVVQEVFIKLWNVHETIDLKRSFSGFLFIVTRNIIFNNNRKKVNEETYRATVLNALENETYDIEGIIDAKNMMEYIDMLIDKMPERRKKIFKLSRKKHKSYKEIASQLNISEKTVENQISAALKYLRENIVLLMIFLMLPNK
jgi:RNA polymerase sigma-70 factor (ECF subfamily)